MYGPVSVIHFDSHLDTWKPKPMPGGPWLPDEEIPVSHGSYFWYAYEEGLLAPNNGNIVGSNRSVFLAFQVLTIYRFIKHVGIRGAINSWEDYDDDYEFGWVISHAWDAEDMGWQGIVKKIRETVGDNPVYSELHASKNVLRIN